jgi:hypothetical protein
MKKEMSKREAYRRLWLQLALPGPMVLFATVLFWSLGGGGGSEDGANAVKKPGLNVSVPAPAREGKAVDKLALYKQAQLDSMRTTQQEKGAVRLLVGRDSGGGLFAGRDGGGGLVGVRDGGGGLPGVRDGAGSGGWAGDSNETRVMRQLADLKARLHVSPGMSGAGLVGSRSGLAGSHPPDMDRLERLLTTLKESGSAGSPEMQELNRTLDKLIAVQQPGRSGRASAVSRVDSGVVALRVTPVGKEAAVSGMKAGDPANNRFYDLESSGGEEEPTGTGIEAIVPATQTLVTGATMRLELATELIIRGQRVGKGATMYGTVRFNNERMLINISSIRCGTEVLPVALRVLDQDGLAGIYSPGSVSRDAARESAGDAVGSIGGSGMDVTTGGQALNAGIQLARNLARRKVQLARVTVKAGYRVFLQDESKGH